MAKQYKYLHLLDDPLVKRWYVNNAKGAKAVAQNYLRGLGRWCELTGLSPKQFIDMPDQERILFVEDFINANPPGRNKYLLKILRSWLNRFNLRLPDFKLGRVPNPRIAKMVIPTQEKLRIVLGVADVRARAAIAITALCGQRIETLGTQEGEDGIILGDFKDLIIFDSPDPEHPGQTLTDTRWDKKPAQLTIRETLSKTNKEYFTFVGPEACELISKWLKFRVASGERLTKESPFLIPSQAQRIAGQRKNPNHKFLWSINVADVIRKPMRASRVMQDQPPSIWRSYFQSHAEMAAGLQKDWREFMVGHGGDISAVYALNKRLTPEKIEAMRTAFKAVLPFIESRVSPDQREHQVQALAAENVELREKVASVPTSDKRVTQKVVSLKELEEHLKFGWTFVATVVPQEKFVVSRN